MQISHRIIQLTLKKALTPQEVWLEHSFPHISRIADVVWPSQKIIFEVQCSPISAKEIQARNRDYQKMGYSVIWILHDRCFNRTRLNAAEHFLRSHSHYFTNINAFGHGEIYDQFAQIRLGRRVKRSPRYPIILSKLSRIEHVPHHFPKERKNWQFSFSNDFFHQASPQLTREPFRFYRTLFNLLLEKNCH